MSAIPVIIEGVGGNGSAIMPRVGGARRGDGHVNQQVTKPIGDVGGPKADVGWVPTPLASPPAIELEAHMGHAPSPHASSSAMGVGLGVE